MATIADELYARVAWLAGTNDGESRHACQYMHETLCLVCHEAAKDSRQAFGSLFAQVDYLCRSRRLSVADTMAIQQMRRDSNGGACASAPSASREADTSRSPWLRRDCLALAKLIAAVTETEIPPALGGVLSSTRECLRSPSRDLREPQAESSSLRVLDSTPPIAPSMRAIVVCADAAHTLRVRLESDGTERDVAIAEGDEYLLRIVREGMTLSLVDVAEAGASALQPPAAGASVLRPRLIVVEPDYLLDISSVARLFTEYGHHPLSYIVGQLSPSANSQAILLGNYAGALLDNALRIKELKNESVKELNGAGALWATTLRQHFAEEALSYATCEDFDEEEYKSQCRRQASNIEEIVAEIRREYEGGFLLEPSFVSPALGLQGRVDLMSDDMRLLVEQKSGKNYNLERHITGPHGAYQREDHYVQLLLYFAVLHQNFALPFGSIDIRLMYSRYPLPDGLLVVGYYQRLLREAIMVRNRVAAAILHFAREGFTERWLRLLTPATLNERGLKSSFYDRYVLPRHEATLAPLHRLSPLETAYFCRMATFIFREQAIAALGIDEGVTRSMADLWNMPLAAKLAQGSIVLCRMKGLKDERGKALYAAPVHDITLARQDNRETDFRTGDGVFLYPYPEDGEPDISRAILYKGSITGLTAESVELHLSDPQPMPTAPDGRLWAVEHGYSSSGLSAGLKALYMFATAKRERRDLLLGLTRPRRDISRKLSRSYHKDYDGVILAAKQALDYYLLVGPPGTGKTSMAMRFMVEEEAPPSPPEGGGGQPHECNLLSPPSGGHGGGLLLTSYTNRAVDEICSMLSAAGHDFIRLGSPYTCDATYHHRLASRRFAEEGSLAAIRGLIERTSIVVATTSMLMAHQEILSLKHFRLTIVDEASQILEPGLIGLLSRLGKFILIGDHKQLPAVVQQPPCDSLVSDPQLRAMGLTDCRRSLFERLIGTSPEVIGTLHTQGRMHPDIAAWPSRMFYRDEALRPVPLPHQTATAIYPPGAATTFGNGTALAALLARHRLLFFNVEGGGEGGDVKSNAAEARLAADLTATAAGLLGRDFTPEKSVGIIVPYRNQISLIRREIASRLGTATATRLTIDTVERYQGSQRDVIIYSTTVMRRHQLSFLTANTFLATARDGRSTYPVDRKLNVAITRARKQMIVVGCRKLLCEDPLFASLIAACKTADYERQPK